MQRALLCFARSEGDGAGGEFDLVVVPEPAEAVLPDAGCTVGRICRGNQLMASRPGLRMLGAGLACVNERERMRGKSLAGSV